MAEAESTSAWSEYWETIEQIFDGVETDRTEEAIEISLENEFEMIRDYLEARDQVALAEAREKATSRLLSGMDDANGRITLQRLLDEARAEKDAWQARADRLQPRADERLSRIRLLRGMLQQSEGND